ncbi:hypothetical protein [Streptomyces aquilus]|uniref:hypothetical protein n=1 Tax=Streptomyces aquilus TaxID=2548456 RepID=UPI0036B5B7D4
MGGGGPGALATARLLYRTRETALGGERWQRLRACGARPPMLLWSGTRAEQVRTLVSWNTGRRRRRVDGPWRATRRWGVMSSPGASCAVWPSVASTSTP